jgi:hypothetical protein
VNPASQQMVVVDQSVHRGLAQLALEAEGDLVSGHEQRDGGVRLRVAHVQAFDVEFLRAPHQIAGPAQTARRGQLARQRRGGRVACHADPRERDRRAEPDPLWQARRVELEVARRPGQLEVPFGGSVEGPAQPQRIDRGNSLDLLHLT